MSGAGTRCCLMPLPGERGNAWTHLAGMLLALAGAWVVGPAAQWGRAMALGVGLFVGGMALMFLCSTAYHWLRPGRAKRVLRKCDHISIYVMIACSYSPICLGVVGGRLGRAVFALLWAVVAVGAFFKIKALGRHPRLSLAAYLVMGWSVVFMARPVVERLTALELCLLLAEGVFYSAGTYFYAHDSRPHFHAVWHVFVLLGAAAHWATVLAIVAGR